MFIYFLTISLHKDFDNIDVYPAWGYCRKLYFLLFFLNTWWKSVFLYPRSLTNFKIGFLGYKALVYVKCKSFLYWHLGLIYFLGICLKFIIFLIYDGCICMSFIISNYFLLCFLRICNLGAPSLISIELYLIELFSKVFSNNDKFYVFDISTD